MYNANICNFSFENTNGVPVKQISPIRKNRVRLQKDASVSIGNWNMTCQPLTNTRPAFFEIEKLHLSDSLYLQLWSRNLTYESST